MNTRPERITYLRTCYSARCLAEDRQGYCSLRSWVLGRFINHLSRQVRTVSLARKGAGRTHGTTPSAKTVSGQHGGSQRAYLELRVSSPSCRFSAAISPSTSSCHPLSIIFCHPEALFFFGSLVVVEENWKWSLLSERIQVEYCHQRRSS